MTLFDCCDRCNSILWGSSFRDGKGKKYCGDCCKCSQCDLKLTNQYWTSEDGKFCCNPCKLQIEVNEGIEASKKFKAEQERIQREQEDLLRQLNELSTCNKCSKTLSKGATYYSHPDTPDEKICSPCYLNELNRERDKIEQERKIVENAKRNCDNKRITILTDEEKAKLSSEGLNLINSFNREIEQSRRQQDPNIPNKDNSQFFDTTIIIIGVIGVIWLCTYFYEKGKKSTKIKKTK